MQPDSTSLGFRSVLRGEHWESMGTRLVLSTCNVEPGGSATPGTSPFSLMSCPQVMAIWTTHLGNSPSFIALLPRPLSHWTSLPNKDLPLFWFGSAFGGIPAKTAISSCMTLGKCPNSNLSVLISQSRENRKASCG